MNSFGSNLLASACTAYQRPRASAQLGCPVAAGAKRAKANIRTAHTCGAGRSACLEAATRSYEQHSHYLVKALRAMAVEWRVRRILQDSPLASDGGGHEPSGHLQGARQHDVGSSRDASCRGRRGRGFRECGANRYRAAFLGGFP